MYLLDADLDRIVPVHPASAQNSCRRQVVLWIRSMPNARRTNKYLVGLETGDVQTRRKCARRLGVPGNHQAVRHLCAALQDNDRHVRGHVAMSLGLIGDRSAVESLIKLVERDTSVGTIRRAIKSLGALSDPAAVS